MKKQSGNRIVSLVMALLLTLAGASVHAQSDAIRVGSKQFTEQVVLGKLIVQALEHAGFTVADQTGLGSSDVNRLALVNGEIDVYPEYTGSAINYLTGQVEIPEGITQDAAGLYEFVSSTDLELNNLVWLDPAPANNTYSFAVTRAFATENDLTSVADLARYVNDGGRIMMAVGDEFAQRADGLQAFERTYGFQLADDQLLVLAGGTPAQTEQALATGANNVNVAMAFATDGQLKAYDFVVLEDPEGAQPVFNPAPVFRADALETHAGIPEVLNPLFALLTNEVMQELNGAVDVAGANPQDVARDFLEANGFLD
jgi:osmoprotectant transport system substrate-binding protein